MANEYLKRTNTSVANKKVFTYSFWMKGNDITTSSQARPIYNYDGGSGLFQFFVERSTNTNPGYWVLYGSGSVNIRWEGTRIDPAAWYHIVLSINTTRTQSEDRAILYINGVRTNVLGSQTGAPGTPGYPALNADQYLGANYINGIAGNSRYQLSDFYYVDGQALTADVFGFYKEGKGYQSSGSTQATDFRPGQWVPKSPRTIKSEINRRGGFGVNGFYLPMNDSSNFGADFHCAPNSIIKLKGEDLPQPRNGAPTTTDAYVSQLRSDPYASNLVLAVPGVELENTNPELVTNGDFSNGTTGWTGLSGGSLSVEDGKLKITETTGALDAYAVNSTAITTVVGKRYTIKWTFHEGTNTTFTIRFGNSGNQSQEYQSNTGANGYGSYPDPGTYSFTFTATATTLNLSFIVNQASSYGYVSNVSVKEAVAVRDYSADIKGSGTNKTLTGVNLAGVYPVPSYYGSAMTFDGSGDYFDTGYSIDGTFGSGDYTIECWIHSLDDQAERGIFGMLGSQYGISLRQFGSYAPGGNRTLQAHFGQSSTGYRTGTTVRIQDQWNHVAMVKEGTIGTLYLNGVAVGIANNVSSTPYSTSNLVIGIYHSGSYRFKGYIQDFRVYTTAKYKGGFDVPKPYTPVGIQSWRQVSDTCKNNFATLNSIDNNSGVLSNGNLTYGDDGSDGWNNSRATIGASSGKWYWEVRADDVISAVMCMSVAGAAGNDSTNGARLGYLPGQSDDAGVTYYPNGRLYHADSQTGGQVGWGASYDDGDIISIALDMDDSGGKVWFAKNNSWQGSGNPATGTNPARNNLKTYADTWFPISGTYFANTAQTFNFGQNPTFSGQITAGTYTDSNGKGLFKYQPPTGFLALCEDNLPTPAIADPGDHFKTVLWTGVDGTNKIKCGFQPDFVWIKNRDYVNWHALYDSIRGPYLELNSNTTSANRDRSSNDGLRSFDSDGFTSGLDDNTGGRPGDSYVAWCWKAGGAAVSNTDGTITSQVSANQTAGFSIVKWTSNGNTSVTTMGHGLAKTPKFMLLKRTVAADNWFVYHSDIQTNNRQYVQLNTTSATITSPNDFWSTSSSTFGIRQSSIAANGQDCIAYCWAEIEGFSKFGSYDGNGNANGPFVYCGFKPAWIMIKPYGSPSDSCYSGGYTSWSIYDSSRSPVNDNTTHERVLFANRAYEEGKRGNGASSGAFQNIDFVSNGFKIRGNSNCETNTTSINGFLFVAFAESPFQTANAK